MTKLYYKILLLSLYLFLIQRCTQHTNMTTIATISVSGGNHVLDISAKTRLKNNINCLTIDKVKSQINIEVNIS